jgi:hypothetical protein
MNWLDESGSERRPLVFVEDHLYHTVDLLTAVREARPRLLDDVAVAVLDRPGPDTDAAVKSCAAAFPEVALVTPSASDLANTASFSKWVGPKDATRRSARARTYSSAHCRSFRPIAGGSRSTWPRPFAACSRIDRPRYGFCRTSAGTARHSAAKCSRQVSIRATSWKKRTLAGTVVPALGSLFDRQFPHELEAARVWPLGDSPPIDATLTSRSI